MKPNLTNLLAFLLLVPFSLGAFSSQARGADSKTVRAETASQAVIPIGMRRTKYGWEDASLWFMPRRPEPRSIDSWIATVSERKPMWLDRSLLAVRSIPPLTVALIQISLVFAIFLIERSYRTWKKQPIESLG